MSGLPFTPVFVFFTFLALGTGESEPIGEPPGAKKKSLLLGADAFTGKIVAATISEFRNGSSPDILHKTDLEGFLAEIATTVRHEIVLLDTGFFEGGKEDLIATTAAEIIGKHSEAYFALLMSRDKSDEAITRFARLADNVHAHALITTRGNFLQKMKLLFYDAQNLAKASRKIGARIFDRTDSAVS